MVSKICTTAFALLAVLSADAWAADAEKHQERTFADCFLYKDPEGHVWLGQSLVSLGMIGTMANHPLYRLSPALAEKLAPLVSELEKPPSGTFYYYGLPRARGGDKPVILLCLEAKMRQIAGPKVAVGPRVVGGVVKLDDPATGNRRPVYEIVSARIVHAEFISPRWRKAWDGLDMGLKTIVAVSRTAPGAMKRLLLAAAIERSSQALGTMVNTPVSDQAREVLRKIDPEARVVRHFQRKIENDPYQWGYELRQLIACLGIAPQTPLPPDTMKRPRLEVLLAESSSPAELIRKAQRSWPKGALEEPLIWSPVLRRNVAVRQVERFAPAEFDEIRATAQKRFEPVARRIRLGKLLVESGSGAEFVGKVKQSCPEGTLQERLPWSQSLSRIVPVGQVAGLDSAAFERLQADAQIDLQALVRQGWLDKPPQPARVPTQVIKQWGVVLRPADPELLAEKLFLGGTLVARLLPDGPDVGLKAGDLIIDYRSTYDLVMGRGFFWSPMRRLAHQAQWGGKLDVLRGERIITIKVEKEK